MFDTSGVTEAFRDEWPRLVATLVRDLRDLDLAEDAAQEAFVEAARRWPVDGRPANPGAWLTTTARRKAIDRMRRRRGFDERRDELARIHDGLAAHAVRRPTGLVDDRLALLLGCCHPALAPDAQVALTLRAVAGLSVPQIARAFLVTPSTMERRLGRAKAKIRTANIPFAAPDRDVLVERLAPVREVISSIFTEGHTSATSTSLVRGDLCDEAVWLAELLAELVPDDPETRGLAALLLFTDARRAARTGPGGELVLLEHQERRLWDRDRVDRARRHLAAAHELHGLGRYQLEAAIAALHTTAPSFDDTDWSAIVTLYDALVRRRAGPVVALNRAVAIGHRDGAAAGLEAIEALGDAWIAELDTYPYLHAARGELLVRLDRAAEAVEAFDRALDTCHNAAERRHLDRRRAAALVAADRGVGGANPSGPSAPP